MECSLLITSVEASSCTCLIKMALVKSRVISPNYNVLLQKEENIVGTTHHYLLLAGSPEVGIIRNSGFLWCVTAQQLSAVTIKNKSSRTKFKLSHNGKHFFLKNGNHGSEWSRQAWYAKGLTTRDFLRKSMRILDSAPSTVDLGEIIGKIWIDIHLKQNS